MGLRVSILCICAHAFRDSGHAAFYVMLVLCYKHYRKHASRAPHLLQFLNLLPLSPTKRVEKQHMYPNVEDNLKL